jgi:hypothetical protein
MLTVVAEALSWLSSILSSGSEVRAVQRQSLLQRPISLSECNSKDHQWRFNGGHHSALPEVEQANLGLQESTDSHHMELQHCIAQAALYQGISSAIVALNQNGPWLLPRVYLRIMAVHIISCYV